jgi:probable rRNA maturation factor
LKSALQLTVQGRGRFTGLPARATLARWITAALDRDAEIVLRFVDAREGRRLNREFRGKDYATDVLTFPYAHSPSVRADIVICPAVVRRATRSLRRPLRDRLAHLVVHATLHALGHDHQRPAAAKSMEAREVEVLAQLGFDDPYLY